MSIKQIEKKKMFSSQQRQRHDNHVTQLANTTDVVTVKKVLLLQNYKNKHIEKIILSKKKVLKKHFHLTYKKKNEAYIEDVNINFLTLTGEKITQISFHSGFCIYSLCTYRLKFVSKFIRHIKSVHTEEQGDVDSKCIIHNEIKEEEHSRVNKLKY